MPSNIPIVESPGRPHKEKLREDNYSHVMDCFAGADWLPVGVAPVMWAGSSAVSVTMESAKRAEDAILHAFACDFHSQFGERILARASLTVKPRIAMILYFCFSAVHTCSSSVEGR